MYDRLFAEDDAPREYLQIYISVYMYVCTCRHIWAYIHVCMHVLAHSYFGLHVCMHVLAHTYLDLHVCMPVYVHVCAMIGMIDVLGRVMSRLSATARASFPAYTHAYV